MRARRMGIAATAAGLALVLAGCGGDAGGGANKQQSQAGSGGGPPSSSQQQAPQGPQAASQAGVQWIGGFCGSMKKFINAYKSTQPPKSQDPAAIQKAMSAQLGSIASGAKTVLADLKKIEPSPIKGGDKLVANAKDSYAQILDSAKKAKSTIEAAPSSDKKAVMQAVKSASSEFKKANQKNPLQQLQSNKKLAKAFRQAPQCKQLAQAAQPQRPQQAQPGAGGQPAPSPGN